MVRRRHGVRQPPRERPWLEQQDIPHVLAIKGNEKLWAWTEEGPRKCGQTG